MFFNRNYIPAVPIREEQRLSEEEELARALKREARIFFPDKKLPGLDEEEHDAVCREEDSLRREADGSISRHEVETARQEAEQIARSRQQLQNSGLNSSQPVDGEIGLQTGGTGQSVQPRLNKQDLKRGIRLQVILDKPRGITPWIEVQINNLLLNLHNYLRSVNYADSAIGYLFELLEENNLLDNTVIVLYGDHDAKLKKSELNKLYESEYYEDVLINKDDRIDSLDEFTYELNRKVPFIIWSKDIVNTNYSKTISEVTGMIDMMPTLSNMLGVTPRYALGHDMFSVENNIVVFPSGNWLTNKLYYNNTKGEYRQLDLNQSVTIEEIEDNNNYAEQLIKISNGIITYDLIKAYETGKVSETNMK